MQEIIPHRAHLEFALDQGETIIFDEATWLEQRNMAILMKNPDSSHTYGQYDLEGRLHVTNQVAQAKAQRLTEVRAELADLLGQPQLRLIKGGKN